jgi:hypothetical protein
MTIPQLRYLLSLGLKEDHQPGPKRTTSSADELGNGAMISPRDEADATDVEVDAVGLDLESDH